MFGSLPRLHQNHAGTLWVLGLLFLGCDRRGKDPVRHGTDASVSAVASSISTPIASSVRSFGSASSAPLPADAGAAHVLKLNHAVMLAIADKKTPLLSLVDPKRGIVFIDDSTPQADNSKPKPSGHLCGAAVTKALAPIQSELSDKKFGLRATYGEERLTCNPVSLECVRRAPVENITNVHFYFRRATDSTGVDRFELRGVAEIDELLVEPKIVAEHQREAIRSIEAHENEPCP